MPRPRFTIRDMIFLVVIVALMMGWFVDHRTTAVSAHSAMLRAEMATREAVVERARAEQILATSGAASPLPAPGPSSAP
jgi:hypothetical protein